MIATVVLRLAGPMQAWSRQARSHGGGGRRPTQDHPTKTGVVGLVANALGRDRADDITDLAALTFAVRADRKGTPQVDYHTAGSGTFPLLPAELLTNPGFARAAGNLPPGTVPTRETVGGQYGAPSRVRAGKNHPTAPTTGRPTVLTVDQYLADAAFTAALTGPADTVRSVADALEQPARQLHLGRSAYPTTGQLLLAVTSHTDPVQALTAAPPTNRHDLGPLTVWSQTLPGPTTPDQPLNFATRVVGGRQEGSTTIPLPPAADHIDFFAAPGQEMS